jgi:hypothetical protein
MTSKTVTTIYHASHIGLIIFLIGALAFGGYFLYDLGYKRGYAKCLKANPPQVNTFNGNSTQIINSPDKLHFLGANIWRLKVSLF